MFKTHGFFNQSQQDLPPPHIPPTASNVAVSGTPVVGNTISGSYTYSGTNPESGTIFTWMQAIDSSGSSALEIDGETTEDYVANITQLGKWVAMIVTPSDGISFGTQKISNWLGPIIEEPGLIYEGALATLSGDASTWSSNWMLVPFDQENLDTDGFFDPSTPGIFTIPEGVAKVRLYAGVALTPSTVIVSVFGAIKKNNTDLSAVGAVPMVQATQFRAGDLGGFNNTAFAFMSSIVEVEEGDFFSLAIQRSSTGLSSVISTINTFFEIEVIE